MLQLSFNVVSRKPRLMKQRLDFKVLSLKCENLDLQFDEVAT